MLTITAYICTRGRYDTTLPLAIQAVLSQTLRPTEFILWDDNPEPVDLREKQPYKSLLSLMDHLGIEWKVTFGGGRGQVHGHHWVNMNAKGDWCWRVDDDCVPESGVLAALSRHETAGAVGPCIWLPGKVYKAGPLASGKIEDIYRCFSPQAFKTSDLSVQPVDHLHCSFLYKTKAVNYDTLYDGAGQREETVFTYLIKRAGSEVLFDPSVITWHLRQSTGGRMPVGAEKYQSDEAHFAAFLSKHGVTPSKHFLLVDMYGIGDAWILRRLVPEIMERHKHPKILVAAMHPEIWEDVPEVTLVAPDAAAMVHGNLDQWNPYRLLGEQPSLRLEDACRKLYGL